MSVMNDETEQAPSQRIKQALMQRGYRLLGRFYRDSQPEEVCQMSYYLKGEHLVLLEKVADRETQREIACELYRAVSTANNLDDTIAAIP